MDSENYRYYGSRGEWYAYLKDYPKAFSDFSKVV